MPLFKCSKCGCIENTALGKYWGTDKPICSECSTGKWHGEFKKQDAVDTGCYYDKNGFLYYPSEVDKKKMEWEYNRRYKMIGIVMREMKDA